MPASGVRGQNCPGDALQADSRAENHNPTIISGKMTIFSIFRSKFQSTLSGHTYNSQLHKRVLMCNISRDLREKEKWIQVTRLLRHALKCRNVTHRENGTGYEIRQSVKTSADQRRILERPKGEIFQGKLMQPLFKVTSLPCHYAVMSNIKTPPFICRLPCCHVKPGKIDRKWIALDLKRFGWVSHSQRRRPACLMSRTSP